MIPEINQDNIIVFILRKDLPCQTDQNRILFKIILKNQAAGEFQKLIRGNTFCPVFFYNPEGIRIPSVTDQNGNGSCLIRGSIGFHFLLRNRCPAVLRRMMQIKLHQLSADNIPVFIREGLVLNRFSIILHTGAVHIHLKSLFPAQIQFQSGVLRAHGKALSGAFPLVHQRLRRIPDRCAETAVSVILQKNAGIFRVDSGICHTVTAGIALFLLQRIVDDYNLTDPPVRCRQPSGKHHIHQLLRLFSGIRHPEKFPVQNRIIPVNPPSCQRRFREFLHISAVILITGKILFPVKNDTGVQPCPFFLSERIVGGKIH